MCTTWDGDSLCILCYIFIGEQGLNHVCFSGILDSLWDGLCRSHNVFGEKMMGGWIGEHSAYVEIWNLDGVTNGEGKVLQHSPYQVA